MLGSVDNWTGGLDGIITERIREGKIVLRVIDREKGEGTVSGDILRWQWAGDNEQENQDMQTEALKEQQSEESAGTCLVQAALNWVGRA